MPNSKAPSTRPHHPILRMFATRPQLTRDCLVVVLTLLTGATDAVGFLRLGGVFTSVMTGNMVLLGVAAGKGEAALAIHASVAFAGYVVGTLAGAHFSKHAAKEGGLWPRSFARALLLEFVIFIGFTIGWWLCGSDPIGAATYVLIVVNAVALGVQSSAVLSLGVPGLSTTYLTGTLTTVIHGIGRRASHGNSGRNTATLCALIGGASLGAATAVWVPALVPALLLGTLGLVLVVGHFGLRRGPGSLV